MHQIKLCSYAGCGSPYATAFSFQWSMYTKLCFFQTSPTLLSKMSKRMVSIQSSLDGDRSNPPTNSSFGRPRLIRAIQSFRVRLGKQVQETRKNLPLKLLFFLMGVYCATAFSTFIGQTGDWDILSAGLAVIVVEGIGALMYGASLRLFENMRSLAAMFNYWKVGLTLGLFFDSFKY